nr:collagen alpha-1(I) chain-like [Anser cygnoides]
MSALPHGAARLHLRQRGGAAPPHGGAPHRSLSGWPRHGDPRGNGCSAPRCAASAALLPGPSGCSPRSSGAWRSLAGRLEGTARLTPLPPGLPAPPGQAAAPGGSATCRVPTHTELSRARGSPQRAGPSARVIPTAAELAPGRPELSLVGRDPRPQGEVAWPWAPAPVRAAVTWGEAGLASKLGNRCGVNLRTAKMCGVRRENGVSPKSSVEQLVLQMFVLGAQGVSRELCRAVWLSCVYGTVLRKNAGVSNSETGTQGSDVVSLENSVLSDLCIFTDKPAR